LCLYGTTPFLFAKLFLFSATSRLVSSLEFFTQLLFAVSLLLADVA
jgi:hypothetical protein